MRVHLGQAMGVDGRKTFFDERLGAKCPKDIQGVDISVFSLCVCQNQITQASDARLIREEGATLPATIMEADRSGLGGYFSPGQAPCPLPRFEKGVPRCKHVCVCVCYWLHRLLFNRLGFLFHGACARISSPSQTSP